MCSCPLGMEARERSITAHKRDYGQYGHHTKIGGEQKLTITHILRPLKSGSNLLLHVAHDDDAKSAEKMGEEETRIHRSYTVVLDRGRRLNEPLPHYHTLPACQNYSQQHYSPLSRGYVLGQREERMGRVEAGEGGYE